MLCLNADDQEQELRALTPEEAARLRSQMEDLLKCADEARAVSASKEEAMRYGGEMWARCEALTAGVFLRIFAAFPPLWDSPPRTRQSVPGFGTAAMQLRCVCGLSAAGCGVAIL